MNRGRVRLSQCMIVKNEEKNIRRALEWAKDIAAEQIVVDTGSTDDTVKIAEEMGAKVYHFEWIDDFSAAKNYAIDQASGNWIAFLDADEYYTKEDARKLMDILEKVEQKIDRREKPHLIRSKWVQLNDKGIPFGVSVQDRVFRNLSDLRYKNRIHEVLSLKSGKLCRSLDCQEELSILHTGYTRQAYAETKKADRNIELLQQEIESDPGNYNAWSYLGDCYMVQSQFQKAEECFERVLDKKPGTPSLDMERFNSAGLQMLKIYVGRKNASDEEKLFQVAGKLGYPRAEDPDLPYYLGTWLFQMGRWHDAKAVLEKCLKLLECYRGTGMVFAAGNMEKIYTWLAAASQRLEQPQDVVRYGVLALRMNRYLTEVLVEILALLKKESGEQESCDGTWGFLSKLYDIRNLKDQLFILKCAKAVAFFSLEERIYASLPEEEKQQIKLKKEYRDNVDMSDNPFGVLVQNRVDHRFVEWAFDIGRNVKTRVADNMRENVEALQKNEESVYQKYVRYYQENPFWGNLDPELGNWETVERRAASIKDHLDDFVWLYGQLEDYRSREVLLAILRNWTYLDVARLNRVKERHPDCYDLDLIPSAGGEVFVDVGAGIGDGVGSFVETYGKGYGKIFAYETTEDAIPVLKRNTEHLHDVDIRSRNLGEVSLDEDVAEPVTWIKVDAKGREYETLLGCRRHIQEERPKLSVCAYYGYEDVWRLPRLIREMEPSYKLYMRYYGGNLIPTRFILTALPDR